MYHKCSGDDSERKASQAVNLAYATVMQGRVLRLAFLGTVAFMLPAAAMKTLGSAMPFAPDAFAIIGYVAVWGHAFYCARRLIESSKVEHPARLNPWTRRAIVEGAVFIWYAVLVYGVINARTHELWVSVGVGFLYLCAVLWAQGMGRAVFAELRTGIGWWDIRAPKDTPEM